MGLWTSRGNNQAKPGDGALQQEFERLIQKGRFKDAVKQAKLCLRAAATPENHRLLERAYLLRADQLRRGAMPTAAQEVAQHLIEFGVTDQSLMVEVVRLLLSLGMIREAQALSERIDSPEVRGGMAYYEVDLAVIDPERVSGSSAEIRAVGQVIRQAIEAVQKGDEAKGLEALREISRGSPFADWKLFVRGLAASARRAESEVRANWDRLDPNRAAARLARTLMDLSGHSSAPPDGGLKVAAKTEALEQRIFGAVVLEPFEQLRALVAAGRLKDAIPRIAAIRQTLARIDPALAVRLTGVLYDPIVKAAWQLSYREAMALAKEFTRACEPLPIDPSWNRFHALLWEGPQGDFKQAEARWRKYLRDLKSLPSLDAEERNLAQALVLNHLGNQLASDTDEFDDFIDVPEIKRKNGRQIVQKENRATKIYEESLALAPNYLPTYNSLIEIYEDLERPDDAAAVARRLLDRFPDDFDALSRLASHHFRREEPEPALDYIRRARAIKPLDQDALETEWSIHILRARWLALAGRHDEARASFAEAERLRPETRQWLHVRARQVVFELKAGQEETARNLILEAQKDLAEPTALWLALLIESIRYELPRQDRGQFEAAWLKALPAKVRTQTAGAIADLMLTFVASEVDYKGRAEHVKHVVGYLARTTRIKYAHDDLKHACSLLSLVPGQEPLLEKLVNRGVKLFPASAHFLMISGALEINKTRSGKGKAKTAIARLKTAREIAETSNNPEDAKLLPAIREILSMIEDSTSRMPGNPFPGFGGGPFSDGPGIEEFDDLFDFMSEMFEDDEFDDDEFANGPPPRPRTRKPSVGRKSSPRKGKAKSR